MQFTKNSIDLAKFHSLHRKTKPREAKTIEDVKENVSDRKYLERRMWSEYTSILEEIVNEEVIAPKYAERKHIHRLVKAHKIYNSDKILAKGKYTKKPIVANNRLAIKRDDLEKCKNNILKFISYIMCLNRYGIFIDGLGHISTDGEEIRLRQYYKVRSGNLFENLVIEPKLPIKKLLSELRGKGQEWEQDADVMKGVFNLWNRKIIPTIDLRDIDFKKIEEKAFFSNLK
jgi:hypothetical protein